MNYTLDHTKNIQFDDSKFKNVHIFNYMPSGLYFNAMTVRKKELNLMKSEYPPPVFSIDLSDPDLGPITCCFHWFSNTLSNYLRFIGLIELLNQNNWTFDDILTNRQTVKRHCSNYVRSVIPDIYKWRNKVSAHFSITDPRSDDNIADLEYSVIYHVSYMQPYYEIGSMNWGTKGQSTNYSRWQLTKVFEDLSERYWPNMKLPSI